MGLHILLLRCLKTLSQMETHKPTITATISASISPSVTALLPLSRHICPPARGRWANGFVVFSPSGAQCVFVFASLCSISRFSPSQPNRLLLSLPSLSWRLHLRSALRLLLLTSLRMSFHHYLCFLRETSSYHHYFPLPPSITPPPFMGSANPVSLCDEYAACCCQVDRNFGMAGAPPRLRLGSLSLPQRPSGFTESCRCEMRATLSSCVRRSLVLASTPDVQLLTGQPQRICSCPSVRLS